MKIKKTLNDFETHTSDLLKSIGLTDIESTKEAKEIKQFVVDYAAFNKISISKAIQRVSGLSDYEN